MTEDKTMVGSVAGWSIRDINLVLTAVNEALPMLRSINTFLEDMETATGRKTSGVRSRIKIILAKSEVAL
jgi:hypothetical protein